MPSIDVNALRWPDPIIDRMLEACYPDECRPSRGSAQRMLAAAVGGVVSSPRARYVVLEGMRDMAGLLAQLEAERDAAENGRRGADAAVRMLEAEVKGLRAQVDVAIRRAELRGLTTDVRAIKLAGRQR